LICPSCGRFIAGENLASCPLCGVKLTSEIFDDARSPAQSSSQPQADSTRPVQGAHSSKPTTATAHCPNCGSPVKESERFCGSCGFNLSTTTTPSIASQPEDRRAMTGKEGGGQLCPYCAKKVLPQAISCPNCGHPLMQMKPSVKKNTTIGRRLAPWLVYCLAAGLVFAAIGPQPIMTALLVGVILAVIVAPFNALLLARIWPESSKMQSPNAL